MEQNDAFNTDGLVPLRPLTLAGDEDYEDINNARKTSHSLRYFDFLVSLSQFSGFLMLVLTGYYFSIINRGYQWGADGEFHGNVNIHGLFMTIGLVFFQGEALLSYRLYRHEPKITSKIIHGSFHFAAIALVTFAMIAVVNAKNLKDATIPHMYSIHSWIGVGIMSVYVVQLALGFLAFFFPKASRDLRRKFHPIHRTVSLISFSASLAQVLLGNQNYQSILQMQRMQYPKDCALNLSCPQHPFLVQNFNMLATVFYGITVIVLSVNPNWRRRSTPDEKEA
ncbi:hypothetical protein L596_011191 [Steinernema carpocapsae]|uniref:Cytochrome b561 domain-containing protein n=1 Tax=Steinernema carpocapsae TaxID=34508 RepID=A0A4U5NU21_STECR|nr:hypothetical protein L596_011191 [Steinernema carpocapsae]